MNHPLAMCVRQAIENLSDNEYDSSRRHRRRTIGKSAYREFRRKHGMAVDYVGVFHGHNVSMAKLGDQTNLVEQALIIALPVYADKRYLQSHPYTLDRISGLPDLAASSFAEAFRQAVLAQPTTAPQTQRLPTSRSLFNCVNRLNHPVNSFHRECKQQCRAYINNNLGNGIEENVI